MNSVSIKNIIMRTFTQPVILPKIKGSWVYAPGDKIFRFQFNGIEPLPYSKIIYFRGHIKLGFIITIFWKYKLSLKTILFLNIPPKFIREDLYKLMNGLTPQTILLKRATNFVPIRPMNLFNRTLSTQKNY